MENAPPIFLLKMKNYFLNCVVEEVLCNRVYVGSPCEKEPHPRAPPMRTSRQKNSWINKNRCMQTDSFRQVINS